MKDINSLIQEAQRTPQKDKDKENSPKLFPVKLLKDKEKFSQAVTEGER